MTNKERILRYLAGKMNEAEKKSFEKDLELSGDLADDMNKINNHLKNIKYDRQIELDENYFTNLIPKVRSRLELKKEAKYDFSFRRGLALGFVILVFFLVIYRTGDREVYLPAENDLSIVSDSTLMDFIDETDYLTMDESFEQYTFADNYLADIELDPGLFLINNSNDFNGVITDILIDDDVQKMIEAISKKKIL